MILSIHFRPSLPANVQTALLHELASAGPEFLSDERVTAVQEDVRSRRTPVYERDWAAFSYLYFAANAAKAHLAGRRFQWADLPRPLRIVDLGAGAGASVLG